MHTSLDSALGRQRRLNSVGESVLQIAPNAAAAYSLRSLTGGDPKVVRVRRKSDNAEQDFTASGVSSGALTSFVNEDVTIYQSDFSAGVNGFVQTSTTTATGNQDGVSDSAGTSKDNVLKVVKAADSQGYMQRDQGVVAGLTYTVSGSFFAPSANTSVDGIMIKDGLAGSSLSDYPSGYLVSDGTWKDFSFSYTAAADGNQRVQLGISSLGSNPNGSSTGSTGDIVYIADLKFVETISNGFVETWYDQSGNSNDAVQETAGSQPKIVSAGSLISKGLDFDGTDDFLQLDAALGATDAQSIFGVVELDALDGSTELILDNRDGGGDGSTYFAASNQFRYLFDSNSPLAQLSASTDTSLVSAFKTSSDVAIGIDGGTLNTASNTDTLSVTTAPRIGSRSFSSGALFFAGEIAELVLYNTDKSADRTAVETNINSHYSLF